MFMDWGINVGNNWVGNKKLLRQINLDRQWDKFSSLLEGEGSILLVCFVENGKGEPMILYVIHWRWIGSHLHTSSLVVHLINTSFH
jgi:hypothetical protein